MTEYCKKALGDYLEKFIDIKSGYSYYDEEVIQQGIAALVNNNIFNPEELRKDILRKCSVLLPLDDIKAWVAKG